MLSRARWQIELLFKLWKSHNRLARHRPGALLTETRAVLWAKLLDILLGGFPPNTLMNPLFEKNCHPSLDRKKNTEPR